MPPVFGPGSPSRAPLEVLRRQQRDDVDAVGDDEQRELGPVEEFLDDDALARGGMGQRGSARSVVTTTPLPAARPSSFTT